MVKLLVGAALGLFAMSIAADAQQKIGVLSDEQPALAGLNFRPFEQGLRELGDVEGKNIIFERRYAEGKNEVLPNLAVELVRLQPDVIVSIGTPATRAAKSATQTIPIVFMRIGDPIGLGLVSTLARPGGNITGVTILTNDTQGKRLELLLTTVPDARQVGVLWDPSFPPAGAEFREIELAARTLGVELIPVGVQGPDAFESALRSMVKQGATAVIVVPGIIFSENMQHLADLTVRLRLPSMFYRREQVEAGGLMSYATDYSATFRRAAALVDKILKGAKPADIPVEQPTKLELVINKKTAETLGITIPPLVLARVDEVIE